MLDQLVGRRLVIVQFIHHAQALVLAQAKAVIGQELIVDHVLVRANEGQDRPDVLLIGIHAGNQRRAGDEVDVGKRFIGFFEVRQDALVAHAGPLLVPLRDRQLVVVEHGIDVGQHFFQKDQGTLNAVSMAVLMPRWWAPSSSAAAKSG